MVPSCCQSCGLFQTARSYRIWATLWDGEKWSYIPYGKNIPKVSVVLVGTCPGREEDEVGDNFVGESGRFLRTFVECMDTSVLLLNVVKCRARTEDDRNRNPSDKEISACSDFLKSQLVAARPKIIGLLGGVALKALWPDGPRTITQARTMPTRLPDGTWLLVTYHPAGYVYAKNDSDRLKMDEIEQEYIRFFRLMESLLSGEKPEGDDRPTYKVVSKSADLMEILNSALSQPMICYDVETNQTAKDPDRNSIWKPSVHILGCGIGWNPEDTIWYVPDRFLSKEFFHNLFRGKILLSHSKFDHIALIAKGLMDLHFFLSETDLPEDTLLMHASEDQGRGSNGLKEVCVRLFGCPDWSAKVWKHVNDLEKARTVENRSRKKNGLPLLPPCSLGDVPFEDLAEYCATDVFNTLRLYEHLKREKKYSQAYASGFLRRLQKMLVLIEANGIGFSFRRAKRLEDLVDARISHIMENLPSFEEVQKVLKKRHPLKVTSWKFLEALLKETRLEVLKFTPSGRTKFDKEVLKELGEKHPVWKDVATAKNLSSLKSGSLSRFLKAYSPDGRIHTSYQAAKVEKSSWGVGNETGGGTVTGRLGSSPNLQNIKKGSVLRMLFVPRPGYLLAEMDYDRGEPVWLTILSRCSLWKNIFLNQLDLYRVMAARFILEKDIHLEKCLQDPEYCERVRAWLEDNVEESLRSVMKTGVLAVMYLQQLEDFCSRVNISLEQGKRFFSSFEKECPEIFQWREHQIETAMAGEPLVTPFGRVRYFQPALDGVWTHHIKSQIVNFCVQSALSDTTCWKAGELTLDRPGEFFVVNLVHDSIWLEVPKKTWRENLLTAKKIMEDMSTLPVDMWGVPLTVSCKVGPDLHAMEKVSL
jgi:uracil-DNA glycosylase family 4